MNNNGPLRAEITFTGLVYLKLTKSGATLIILSSKSILLLLEKKKIERKRKKNKGKRIALDPRTPSDEWVQL